MTAVVTGRDSRVRSQQPPTDFETRTKMATDDFAFLDATAQAELVRTGQASPAELVDAAIARIDALNPQLHALIHERFDKARDAARNPLPGGPFRGVPVLFKDL